MATIESTFDPFDPESGLILATSLPGSAAELDENSERRKRGFDGLGREAFTSDESATQPPIWVHLDRTRPRAQQWLREESGLDPLVVESLLAEETRPRVQEVAGDGDTPGTPTPNHGLLVILRGVNMNPGAEPDDLISIRLFLDARRVITLRQFKFQTIIELRKRVQAGTAPKTPGAFLAAVATGLSVRLHPVVENLEEMLDDIEEALLSDEIDDDPQARSKLAEIRRQAITYRRHLIPQREALLRLETIESPLISKSDRVEIRVAAEHVMRVTEALEELRDRAAVTQEEIRARHEARVGKTLYLLTIVATIALPLSLLTGLLGINVGGIPLADSSLGFLLVCAGMGVLAVVEFVIFKWLKWL